MNMSEISGLAERIQETDARIKDFERAVAANPDIPSLALSLRSFKKMRQRLEVEFEEIKESAGAAAGEVGANTGL